MKGSIIAGGRRIVAGVAALLILAAAVAAQLVFDAHSPSPVSADAPQDAFSTERATEIWRDIAAEPRPLGSPESDRVRDKLAQDLADLGFDVDIETGLGTAQLENEAVFSPVDNIVGTLPGSESTGRVLLVSHYDSTGTGPGAADAAMQVASIMESARALQAKGTPRNDIVVLLTDGEEEGLLGADAYTRAHPSDGTDLVLNWEARGTGGPSLMFESSPDNQRLIDTYAEVVPHPAGDSSGVEIYRYMSNDTDFTRFMATGYIGLNSANIKDPAWYHTAGDTIDNVDPATMQHHGENMLALATAFAGADLTAMESDSDASYAKVFSFLVSYSPTWGLILALGAVVVLAFAIGVARRRRLLSLPRLLTGATSVLAPLVLAAALGEVLWILWSTLQPGLVDARGMLYRPAPYLIAIGLLTAGVILAWYLTLRRSIGPAALALGALTWPALLGLASAILAPGAAFGFVLPALCAGIGALAALLLNRPLWAAVAVTAGLVPAAALQVSGAIALFDGFGLVMAGALAAMLALLGVMFAPVIELFQSEPDAPRRRFGWLSPTVTVVLALAVAVGSTMFTGFSAERPRQSHLTYVLDAETQTAGWLSRDADASEWTRQHATDPGDKAVPPAYINSDKPPTWSGEAEPVDLAPPTAEAVREGDTIVMHVESPRDADALTVKLGPGVTAATAELPGSASVTVPIDAAGSASSVRLLDLPDDGIDLRLTLAPGAEPDMVVFDETVGLEDIPGIQERPDDLIATASHTGELVVVIGTVVD